MFVTFTAGCVYQLHFRSDDKDKRWGVATINHPTHVKNHIKSRIFEKYGYKLYRINKLTIFTYNSFK